METRDLVENSSAKLTKKNLDMVVANNLKVAGAGFGVDTNCLLYTSGLYRLGRFQLLTGAVLQPFRQAGNFRIHTHAGALLLFAAVDGVHLSLIHI